jgi:hypothetical protein
VDRGAALPKPDDDTVTVGVRIRPLNHIELGAWTPLSYSGPIMLGFPSVIDMGGWLGT